MNDFKNMAPVVYIPHGGGPLPLLGDTGHQSLVKFLTEVPKLLTKPEAILIISAHWEETIPTIQSAKNPPLIYDYYGFPEESYGIQYPAVGAPVLVEKMGELLNQNNILFNLDGKRGYDHGMFVPLKLMYPNADIPCVQLSLLKNLDSASHIQLGESLSKIREENILIVGSGLSFHNLRAVFSPSEANVHEAELFHTWLLDVISRRDLTYSQKKEALTNWNKAHGARFSHPREEHLLPLHVCFGMSMNSKGNAKIIYEDALMGFPACGFLWED